MTTFKSGGKHCARNMSNLPCFPIFPYLTPLQFRHFSNLPSPTSGLPGSSPESPTSNSNGSTRTSISCHGITNTTSSSPRNSFSIESILSGGCTGGSSNGSGQQASMNKDLSDFKSNVGRNEGCTGSIAGANAFPHLQFLHHPAFLPNQAAAEFLGKIPYYFRL